MQNKIVYTDNKKDIAITGTIISEDNFFIKIESRGTNYRIGKKSIVCIKQVINDKTK